MRQIGHATRYDDRRYARLQHRAGAARTGTGSTRSCYELATLEDLSITHVSSRMRRRPSPAIRTRVVCWARARRLPRGHSSGCRSVRRRGSRARATGRALPAPVADELRRCATSRSRYERSSAHQLTTRASSRTWSLSRPRSRAVFVQSPSPFRRPVGLRCPAYTARSTPGRACTYEMAASRPANAKYRDPYRVPACRARIRRRRVFDAS